MGNIPKLSSNKFGRYFGSADVWGVLINNTNYALATLDRGLSIVNTNNTAYPIEVVHINHTNYNPTNYLADRLHTPDVKTYTQNGITYAYLATADPNNTNNNPLVIIINFNAAINQGGLNIN